MSLLFANEMIGIWGNQDSFKRGAGLQKYQDLELSAHASDLPQGRGEEWKLGSLSMANDLLMPT